MLQVGKDGRFAGKHLEKLLMMAPCGAEKIADDVIDQKPRFLGRFRACGCFAIFLRARFAEGVGAEPVFCCMIIKAGGHTLEC